MRISEGQVQARSEDFAQEAHTILRRSPREPTIELLQSVAILAMYERAFGDPHLAAGLARECAPDSKLGTALSPSLSPTDNKVRDAVIQISAEFHCFHA